MTEAPSLSNSTSTTTAAANNRQIELKVVLIGAVGVGKTSTVLRFIKDNFKDYLETTIGASYMNKTLPISGKSIKFSVWDTAGQEQYHSLVPLYFRKASAVIIVYDITRQKTFEDAQQWVKELRAQAPDDAILVLTGNKSDLSNLREVEPKQGQAYADQIGALFAETSAKVATGINEVFEKVGQTWLDRNDTDKKDNKLTPSTTTTNENTVSDLGKGSGTPHTDKKPCCGG